MKRTILSTLAFTAGCAFPFLSWQYARLRAVPRFEPELGWSFAIVRAICGMLLFGFLFSMYVQFRSGWGRQSLWSVIVLPWLVGIPLDFLRVMVSDHLPLEYGGYWVSSDALDKVDWAISLAYIFIGAEAACRIERYFRSAREG